LRERQIAELSIQIDGDVVLHRRKSKGNHDIQQTARRTAGSLRLPRERANYGSRRQQGDGRKQPVYPCTFDDCSGTRLVER
jgi:hypothetical protein